MMHKTCKMNSVWASITVTHPRANMSNKFILNSFIDSQTIKSTSNNKHSNAAHRQRLVYVMLSTQWSSIEFNCNAYSISQEICTGFLLCCALLWLYIDWFSHIHQAYFTGTVAVPAKQPWWIWLNTSCEFIMNDSITTTKQSTTKPCAYFFGYTVIIHRALWNVMEPHNSYRAV